MRIVVLNVDYLDFLDTFYGERPELRTASYDVQQSARMATLMGVADFYSHALHELGHDAFDIHANNWWMQLAWANEHGGWRSGAAARALAEARWALRSTATADKARRLAGAVRARHEPLLY